MKIRLLIGLAVVGVLLAVVGAAILLPSGGRVGAGGESSPEEVGCVSTTFRFASPNDKVCVTAYPDPAVPGVTCYLSQARVGGYTGALGLAEDPSRFSIACAAAGPVSLPADLPEDAYVFSERTSIIFKKTTVRRFVDRKRGVLVYLGISTKIIEGSPMNSVSVVPYLKQ
jgi:CreA protein